MAYDEGLARRIHRLLTGREVEERPMFGGLAFLAAVDTNILQRSSSWVAGGTKKRQDREIANAHDRWIDYKHRKTRET